MRTPAILRLLLAAVLALTTPTLLATSAVAADGVSMTASISSSTPQGLTVEVSGTGYAQTPPGIYVGVSESGGASATDASVYRGTEWVSNTQIGEGGTFQVTLELDSEEVATLDPTKTYSVYTLKAHGQAAVDPSQNAEQPIDIDFSTFDEPAEPTDPEPTNPEPTSPEPTDPEPTDPEPTDPEPTDPGPGDPEPSQPTVTISQSEFSPDGASTVTVEGTGFDPSLATGTRPPLMGKPSGVYVAFGKFAHTWKPSEGAASSARATSDVKWAVSAEDMALVGGPDRGAIELRPDGSFTAELTVDKAAIDALVASKENAAELANYGVYTYPGGGASQPLYETYTPISFTDPEPEPTTGPRLDAEIGTATEGNLVIDVVGSGYAKQAPGVYVTIAPSGGADTTNPEGNFAAQWVPDSQMDAEGGFEVTLTATEDEIEAMDPDQEYSVYTFRAHGMPDLNPSQTVEVPLTGLDVAALQGDDGQDPEPPTEPEQPTNPGTGTGGTTPAPRTSGSLLWGVNSGFRSYVTGPIAKGSIAVSGGAASSGGTFRFFQRSTSSNSTGVGTTNYGGTVTFSGHGGQLNMRISDPAVRVESASRGVLTAVVGGSRIDLATLDLSRAAKSTRSGATTFNGAPARLTAAGSRAFQGYYGAGQVMDPVTFTIGASGGASNSATQTVAAASATDVIFDAPPTPPASSGLVIENLGNDGELTPGSPVTISADGFQPGETGIAVVVYSDPVVLSQTVVADASGRVDWTGPLPGNLEPGEHTLTLQGSVDRGATFLVLEEEIGECTIEDASLTWGVKESFRSYVSGTIANGDWSTSGNASYETPEFTFADGEGDFSTADSAGELTFEGAIDFTGHDGALAVTLENPVVTITDENTATLLLDVTAADRAEAEAGNAEPTLTEGVPFVDIDLSAATVELSDDSTSWTVTDAPTELTEQGSQVFSSYQPGEAFDPIDLSVTAAVDCATVASIAEEPAPVQVATTASGTTDEAGWWWWALGGMAVASAAGAGWWLRGRAAQESQGEI